MGQDKNKLTRRQLVMVGLGTLVLGGCASTGRRAASTRPTANWHGAGYPARPTGHQGYTPVQPAHHPPTEVVPAATTPAINAIARSDWTRSGPITKKVNPMKGVTKITIHHEGSKAVYFTDRNTTKDRIEKIRKHHVNNNGWGDIGYHYIVDRSGRVWEGRPIAYQGAHVSQNNENNLGILVLGNFDKQSPSSAQLDALFSTAAELKRYHRVKSTLVRSHQEITATSCPGKNLQRKMDALRKHVG